MELNKIEMLLEKYFEGVKPCMKKGLKYCRCCASFGTVHPIFRYFSKAATGVETRNSGADDS
jgi:hypothetical protein